MRHFLQSTETQNSDTIPPSVVSPNLEDDQSVETSVDNHKLPKIYSCKKCGKMFSRKKYANSHCTKASSWICSECGVIISQENNISRHKNKCGSKKIAKNQPKKDSTVDPEPPKCFCPFCGSCFKNIPSMTTHINKKHQSEKIGDFLCDMCEFRTAKESHLKKHVTMTHTIKVNSFFTRTNILKLKQGWNLTLPF